MDTTEDLRRQLLAVTLVIAGAVLLVPTKVYTDPPEPGRVISPPLHLVVSQSGEADVDPDSSD